MMKAKGKRQQAMNDSKIAAKFEGKRTGAAVKKIIAKTLLRWERQQRKFRRMGVLTVNEIAALDKVGFPWKGADKNSPKAIKRLTGWTLVYRSAVGVTPTGEEQALATFAAGRQELKRRFRKLHTLPGYTEMKVQS
jgi:hypothetical protein